MKNSKLKTKAKKIQIALNNMATIAIPTIQSDNKILCAGPCGKPYTKATLDKNGGLCGRCANKNKPEEGAAPITQVSLPSSASVFPHTSSTTQLQLPTMLANLSLSTDGKTAAPHALTVAARLDQWVESSKKADPNNLKLKAAVDYVAALHGTTSDLKRLENVVNVHILALEKGWDTLAKIYMM